MIPDKPIGRRLILLTLSFFIFSFINNIWAQDGKALFMSKCASCHNVFKDATGPKLGGLEERHKWADHNELLAWVNNPGAYIARDPYTQGLLAQYKSMMTGFPDLKLADIDAIVSYINTTYAAGPGGGKKTEDTTTDAKGTSQNAVIFGVISLILAIIALILMQVNSNLKKMSDDAEGIHRPEPVPIYRNKVYIAMAAIIFFGRKPDRLCRKKTDEPDPNRTKLALGAGLYINSHSSLAAFGITGEHSFWPV